MVPNVKEKYRDAVADLVEAIELVFIVVNFAAPSLLRFIMIFLGSVSLILGWYLL